MSKFSTLFIVLLFSVATARADDKSIKNGVESVQHGFSDGKKICVGAYNQIRGSIETIIKSEEGAEDKTQLIVKLIGYTAPFVLAGLALRKIIRPKHCLK